MAYKPYEGFTFNNHHSSEFNIVRVSDGSRYQDNLSPSIDNKTSTDNRISGTMLTEVRYGTRAMSFNIAFVGMTELQKRDLTRWLDGLEEHDLQLDEDYNIASSSYEWTYRAKVTGTPQIKFIMFMDGTNRYYNGEGTIQFTLYYPYAVGPVYTRVTGDPQIQNAQDLPANVVVFHGKTLNPGDPCTIKINGVDHSIYIQEGRVQDTEWNPSTGIVLGTINHNRHALHITGNPFFTINKLDVIMSEQEDTQFTFQEKRW